MLLDHRVGREVRSAPDQDLPADVVWAMLRGHGTSGSPLALSPSSKKRIRFSTLESDSRLRRGYRDETSLPLSLDLLLLLFAAWLFLFCSNRNFPKSMMRQTVGSGVGRNLHQVEFLRLAQAAALRSGIITPTCSPSSPMMRSSGAVISRIRLMRLYDWGRMRHTSMTQFRRGSRLLARPASDALKRHRPEDPCHCACARPNELDPRLALARDQQVRDPLQGVFADFKADFLVTQIHFDAKP